MARAFAQFFRRLAVEGQHQHFVRRGDPGSHRIPCPGNHGGRLARAGRGDQQNQIIEAHSGLGLLPGQELGL